MSNLDGFNLSAACNNSYTIGCDALFRRQHYCVCVNFLRAVEEDRIGESFSDCQAALKRKDCVAFSMREEEKRQNTALYYKERQRLIVSPNPRPISTRKKKRRTLPKDENTLMVGSRMSDIINAALSPCARSTYPKPKRGEALITFARRFSQYEKAQVISG